jgi:3-hydroxyisobutyrate dehydrogenase-like beta-hydroxyacid dehydrogenase
MKIGFIGLGQMGKPMAMNLRRNGVELMVHVRNKPASDLEAAGIAVTKDLQDIARCEIIFLCLPDTQVVTEILLHENGLAESLRPGQIVCDFSTIDYQASITIAETLAARAVEYLDAPISGMAARAIDGTLTIMCGGKKPIFDQLLPCLRFMGTNILYMGPSGCGQLTKAINNTLFDINMAALAEILPVAAKLGLDPGLIGSVINSSSGRSFASEFFIPRILNGNFGDGYPLEKAYKDLVSTPAFRKPLLALNPHARRNDNLANGHAPSLGDHGQGPIDLPVEALRGKVPARGRCCFSHGDKTRLFYSINSVKFSYHSI